jgi:glutamate formiminotransferase
MGATDVIPFTPILGITMEECVALAKELGLKIAQELKIPVYLYEEAAQRPERVNLANVRKGEFEGLSREIETNPNRKPDFGEAKIHPTAGATAVGAREQIINFNVNLKSSNIEIAKNIAKAIRSSSGGLANLRAKEIELSDVDQVQVSTVLTNYKETDLASVFSEIQKRAKDAKVDIAESELIGLVPAKALVDFACKTLKARKYNSEGQLLEIKLLEFFLGMLNEATGSKNWAEGLRSVCDALGSQNPVPGGGSASAAMAALGASLVSKVLKVWRGKLIKKDPGSVQLEKLKELISLSEGCTRQFLDFAQRDCQDGAV